MNKKNSSKNRFGKDIITNIPKDAPLVGSPGHKLRTTNIIVDRKILAKREQKLLKNQVETEKLEKLKGQELEFVEYEDQIGAIRITPDVKEEQQPAPNLFTGPSYRNKPERFRFDGHKMMHHLDRLAAWQRGERFAPIHIDMGLTKFCNTACIYCYAVVQNMTKGAMIGRDALLQYVEDCGKLGVRSIGFVGDGEPTLNPTLYDATVLAKEVGVDTAMATNGILLDMDRAHDLLKNMTWIRFNLSAGNAKGFKKVHQSSAESFDLLIDKIRELIRIRRENSYTCTLGLQMVLIPECFDQVIPEAKLGAELGVDYFVIKHCSDSEYKEIGINYQNYVSVKDILKEAESYSNDHYVVQVKWNKIMAAGESSLYKNGYRKYDVCHGTPFLLQISGNGKIYPCGPFFNKERFYIGDLHEQSFFNIAMSDRYWMVHREISEVVDVHKDCAIGCRQDYVNKFLWDLKNVPEHVNFI